MKIARKVFTLTFAISAVTLTFAVLFVYISVERMMTDARGTFQAEAARHTMDEIDAYVCEKASDLEAVSGSLVAGGFESRELEEAAAKMVLENALVATGPWDALLYVDSDGGVVAEAGYALADSADVMRLEAEALSHALVGESFVSEAIRTGDGSGMTMAFAGPVDRVGPRGLDRVGMVVGYLSWPALAEILDRAPSHAVLFGRDGERLASNARYVVGGERLEGAPYPLGFLSESNATVLPAFQTHLGTEDALVTSVAQHGCGDFAGHGWVLALETPLSVAAEPVRGLVVRLTLLFILLSAVVIGGSISGMFPMVIHPIIDIARVARSMGRGDERVRATVRARDEVGVLAQSLNGMADQLFESNHELERVVSELETSNRKIATDKARDEAMLASIGEGIVATDERGEVVMMNAAAEAMLGYASQELVGFPYKKIALLDEHGKGVLNGDRPMLRALKTGRRVEIVPTESRWSYVRKDGQPFPVSITASPVVFRGKTVGVIEVFRDIRKEVEQDRILHDFISIASHQLRSPLTGIYWILDRVLREERLSREGRQNLKDVHLLTRNLGELVSLMLNASRIDAGKIPLVVEELDIVRATKRHLAGYQPLCDRKTLTCTLETRPASFKARTVSSLFSLIIEALISNAIDYTPAGGTVRVCVEKKRGRFLLTVRDTGIGIPEPEYGRVFQKFYRGSNAVVVKPGGTGLGLYSVRQAALLLGGNVRFESKVGEGTTFFVELPLETKISPRPLTK